MCSVVLITLGFIEFSDMLMGLKQGQAKMSKSDPESAIFMEDEAVCYHYSRFPSFCRLCLTYIFVLYLFQIDVSRKIINAYCPPNVIIGNPCIDYVKHIVFGKFSRFSCGNTYVTLCENCSISDK